jgi:hypothetical protein
MAISKNKKGFRKIVVEGHNFNWRFDRIIDIRPENNKDNKLIVDFGWYDVWLYVNDKENRPPDFQPETITPAFVRRAILFALNSKWDIQIKTGLMKLNYREEVFEVNRLQEKSL